jgi:transcriptional regulator with XRE-family HTH domain
MNGDIIKKIRIEKGYILAELAKKTGYTASYLSQIERDIKKPSLEALRKIADALNTPIIAFLMSDNEEYIHTEVQENDSLLKYSLLRESNRKRMIIPEIGTEYQLITPIYKQPNNKPRMLGLYIELKPRAWIQEKFVTHEPEESIIVITGQIDVYFDDKIFTLSVGDSFYIASNIPHNIQNTTDENAIVIIYQSPAMY